MNVQKIIKYLLGLIVITVLFCIIVAIEDRPIKIVNNIRNSRGLIDILLGKFRPCINCMCGKSNRGGARFLGGEYTNTHEFPWLANIYIKKNLIISGILINDRYILTTASHLINATPSEVKVSLGEYDRCHLDVSSVIISVNAIISHPEFNYESRAHDLTLVRLSRSTKFERRISPICLPDTESTYLGQVGTVIGWMEFKNEENLNTKTCRPRKLGLPILGRRECLKSGIQSANYHEDSGCVGIIGSTSVICKNDVGTSVLHRSYNGFYDLVGIFSDINNCNHSQGTAIYTKIGPHLEWIYRETKDSCYCLKPLHVPEIKSFLFAY